MTLADMTAYFLTLIAITLAPGPVVLMLMVRAASRDTLGAAFFGIGFAVGGVMIIAAVCFGMGAWLQSAPEVFVYGKYVMLAYILYLAHGIWKSGLDVENAGKVRMQGGVVSFFAGIMTCMISPYMMILFPMVLPGIVDIDTLDGAAFSLISVTTFIALGTGAAIVIVFASQLWRIARSPMQAARVNRTLALVLASAGSYMALT